MRRQPDPGDPAGREIAGKAIRRSSALAASGRVTLEHLEGDLDRGVVFGDLAIWADLGRPGLHVGADQLAQRLGG